MILYQLPASLQLQINAFIVCTFSPEVKLLWLAYREQKTFLVSSDVYRTRLWVYEWLQYNTFPSSVVSSHHPQLCNRRDLKVISCRTAIPVNYAECGNRTVRFSGSWFDESGSIKKFRKISIQMLFNICFYFFF